MGCSKAVSGKQHAMADKRLAHRGDSPREVLVECARASACLCERALLDRLPLVNQSPWRCSISPPLTSRQKTPASVTRTKSISAHGLAVWFDEPDAVNRRPSGRGLVAELREDPPLGVRAMIVRDVAGYIRAISVVGSSSRRTRASRFGVPTSSPRSSRCSSPRSSSRAAVRRHGRRRG